MAIDRSEVERILSSVAGSYTKRWLEGNFYDWVFATDPGKWLKNLDPPIKYAIEAGLYLSAARFIRPSGDSSAIGSYALDILSDAAPEIAKRIINGESPHTPAPEPPPLSAQDTELLRRWLSETTVAERRAFLDHLAEQIGDQESEDKTETGFDEALKGTTERMRQRRLERANRKGAANAGSSE